ncbi:MAG TPA: sortase [Patescibacteria group bacterium]|nr:sortase [Patescibacteria group bacterium]
MSIPSTKLPLSAVIFDRSLHGVSDVPIFAQALFQKVNTPQFLSPKTAQILHRSSPEKAAPTFFQAPVVSGQAEPGAWKSAGVSWAEDPTIIRPTVSADALQSYLRDIAFKKEENKRVIREIWEIGVHTLRLNRTHSAGLLDVVILPETKLSPLQYALDQQYAVRQYVRVLRKLLKKLYPSPMFGEPAWPVGRGIKRSVMSEVEKLIEKISGFNFELSVDWTPAFAGVTDKLQKIIESLAEFSTTLPSFTRIAANTMIVLSIVLMLMTVGPMAVLEGDSLRHRLINSLSPKADDVSMQSAAHTTQAPVPTPTEDPRAIIPAEKQFQIQIPKIGVDSRVIANVDPSDETAYAAALKQGVAHAMGTDLPGVEDAHTKTVYIFGHSTNAPWNISKYNALFYNLKDLSAGDFIRVWFWGKEYDYSVTDRKILAADDVSYLQPQTEKDQLVLQTCWPPGTSLNRLIVVAQPVK